MKLPARYSYTRKSQLRGPLSLSQRRSQPPSAPTLALTTAAAMMDSRAGKETLMAEGPASHFQFLPGAPSPTLQRVSERLLPVQHGTSHSWGVRSL